MLKIYFIILLIVVPLIFSGCSKPMNDQEVVEKIEYCEKLGFKYVAVQSSWYLGEVVKVRCDFKEKLDI